MQKTHTLQDILCEVKPPSGLIEHISFRVAYLEHRSAKLRCAGMTVLSFLLGATLVPLAGYAGQEFYTSGFYDYATLFFSGWNFFSTSGGELAYTLVESLPSIALLLVCTASIALLWSISRAVSNARVVFKTPHIKRLA